MQVSAAFQARRTTQVKEAALIPVDGRHDYSPKSDDHQYRPLRGSVLRGVTLVGGVLGTTGASLSGHQIIAISTLLVTAAIIAVELWIAKRRDDLFGKLVSRSDVDPDVLRAVIVHEAVRSGLLSSQDAAKLLRGGPSEHDRPP
jgi:hypothetical protein